MPLLQTILTVSVVKEKSRKGMIRKYSLNSRSVGLFLRMLETLVICGHAAMQGKVRGSQPEGNLLRIS